MIEKGLWREGCTNNGTTPGKTMREAVLHPSGFYYQNFYGANYRVKETVTMADLHYRIQRAIESEVSQLSSVATEWRGSVTRSGS